MCAPTSESPSATIVDKHLSLTPNRSLAGRRSSPFTLPPLRLSRQESHTRTYIRSEVYRAPCVRGCSWKVGDSPRLGIETSVYSDPPNTQLSLICITIFKRYFLFSFFSSPFSRVTTENILTLNIILHRESYQERIFRDEIFCHCTKMLTERFECRNRYNVRRFNALKIYFSNWGVRPELLVFISNCFFFERE